MSAGGGIHKNCPLLQISVLVQVVIMKCSVDISIYLTDLYTRVPHHTPSMMKLFFYVKIRSNYICDAFKAGRSVDFFIL